MLLSHPSVAARERVPHTPLHTLKRAGRIPPPCSDRVVSVTSGAVHGRVGSRLTAVVLPDSGRKVGATRPSATLKSCLFASTGHTRTLVHCLTPPSAHRHVRLDAPRHPHTTTMMPGTFAFAVAAACLRGLALPHSHSPHVARVQRLEKRKRSASPSCASRRDTWSARHRHKSGARTRRGGGWSPSSPQGRGGCSTRSAC